MSQDLIKFEQEGYSTVLVVPTTPGIKCIDPTEEINGIAWKSHIISYVLTKLSDTGTIFSEWTKGSESALWGYCSKVCSSHQVPEMDETLFMQNPTMYRMILGYFGMSVSGMAYLAAGIFFLRFYDRMDKTIQIAYMLSNTKETGFWLRLQSA